ncbi:TetR family transcriptional regulator [Conexibacter arvalis]|uniref:AcrR family transcriptional regulator n=1 Tax=Conexibacter arvalis TaxID=912552 RepID=A0A840IJV2_9ACTN|nr:TetR family transcriptional regulator [Conexibacter arvalis]MBB4664220.1 AcrR family transcriptional regulator [Conexibacter arvalis]
MKRRSESRPAPASRPTRTGTQTPASRPTRTSRPAPASRPTRTSRPAPTGAGAARAGARRRGPRGDGAREAILAAAREQFAARGLDGATMRAIAAAAGVDVALVSYYFGSKADLFVASLQLPVNPADVIDGLLADGTDGLGERLVTRLIAVWDEPASGGPLADVLRSAAPQFELLRGFLQQQIVARLARALDDPDAELRATAVASQVLGLLLSRYVLRVEPLASAPPERVVALVGPTLQRYFDGEIG